MSESRGLLDICAARSDDSTDIWRLALMKVTDLAKWMREEHNTVDDLIAALRRETASVPKANLDAWLDRTRDRFAHFRAHLLKHMALEVQDGYLPAVRERQPTLSKEVARLEHEHGEMTRIMGSIHRALAEVSPHDRLLIRECCQRIGNLLTEVQRHEADENMMVMSVFTRDIGTID